MQSKQKHSLSLWQGVLGLLLFGTLGPSAFAQDVPPATVEAGEDRLVSIGLADRPLVEPYLVAHPSDPSHLLGGVIVIDEGEAYHCAAFVSFDGGHSWRRHDFPVRECADPWIVLREDGTALFAGLGAVEGLSDDVSGVYVFRSEDGGRTWSEEPVHLGDGHDHQTLVVDDSESRFAGSFYLLSVQGTREEITGGDRSTVFVARSDDGGRSFNEPTLIIPSNLNLNTMTPVVLADGTLAVSYNEFQRRGLDERVWLEREHSWLLLSNDGGQSFSAPLFISESCGKAFPTLTADRSTTSPYHGQLYWLCHDINRTRVYLHHSPDRGERWSDPVRVGRGPEGSHVRTPAIAINDKGIVGISWYDTRHDPESACTDLYFAASLDGGRTFLAEVRVSSASSCPDTAQNGWAGRRWPAGGDYSGLVATPDGVFHILWADSRENVYQLHTATVEVYAKATNAN